MVLSAPAGKGGKEVKRGLPASQRKRKEVKRGLPASQKEKKEGKEDLPASQKERKEAKTRLNLPKTDLNLLNPGLCLLGVKRRLRTLGGVSGQNCSKLLKTPVNLLLNLNF